MKKGLVCLLLLCLLLQMCIPVLASEQTAGYTGGPAGSKLVALTFDDGPHPRYTEKILAILAKYSIPATFFFIGSNVEYFPEVARKVAAAGHEIGNHTQNHPHLQKIDDARLLKEIQSAQEVIRRTTGVVPVLFRAPEGRLTRQRKEMIRNAGLRAIFWSVDTLDWKGTASEAIAAGVMHNVHGGDIILCHDYVGKSSTTLAALEKFIPALLEQGYEFVTVSQLIASDEVQDKDSSSSFFGVSSACASGFSSGCSL